MLFLQLFDNRPSMQIVIVNFVVSFDVFCVTVAIVIVMARFVMGVKIRVRVRVRIVFVVAVVVLWTGMDCFGWWLQSSCFKRIHYYSIYIFVFSREIDYHTLPIISILWNFYQINTKYFFKFNIYLINNVLIISTISMSPLSLLIIQKLFLYIL